MINLTQYKRGDAMLELARRIMELMEINGYQAYLVGGCVRDYLMNRVPKDYDITTNATPEQVIEVMNNNSIKTVPTGIKFGTVTAYMNGFPFEITTYRSDGKYSDYRRPEEVSFSQSVEEDLARCDYTINAMVMDRNGTVYDPFDGMDDIKRKLIRCVGNAADRFKEDPLRIMRGIRFALKYRFDISYTTRKAMENCAPLLLQVSVERIFSELKQIVQYGDNVLSTLQRCGALQVILPELMIMKDFEQNNPHHNLDLMKHTERTMHNVDGVEIKLAAMFHDAGKPSCKDYANDTIAHYYGHAKVSADIARAFLLRMKASADEIKHVLPLVKLHDMQLTDKAFKRVAAKYSPEIAKDLIKLQLADKLAQVYNEENINHLRELQTRQEALLRHPFTVNDLAVNGHDLMQIGIPEGPEIGSILKEMLEIVLDNPEMNTKEQLMSIVQITA